MAFGRRMYAAFMAATTAHARWDYETSMSILHNKKKMRLLAFMVIPIILVSIAFAAGDPSELPSILGGKKAYAPAFYTPGIFIASAVTSFISLFNDISFFICIFLCFCKRLFFKLFY